MVDVKSKGVELFWEDGLLNYWISLATPLRALPRRHPSPAFQPTVLLWNKWSRRQQQCRFTTFNYPYTM